VDETLQFRTLLLLKEVNENILLEMLELETTKHRAT
jgi:hypothetical protein